ASGLGPREKLRRVAAGDGAGVRRAGIGDHDAVAHVRAAAQRVREGRPVTLRRALRGRVVELAAAATVAAAVQPAARGALVRARVHRIQPAWLHRVARALEQRNLAAVARLRAGADVATDAFGAEGAGRAFLVLRAGGAEAALGKAAARRGRVARAVSRG